LAVSEEKNQEVAEDRNLTCRDCGKTFVFTAGEQAFFAEKGLSDPIRCPDCRRLRKQQRTSETIPPSSPRTDSGFRSNGPRADGESRPPGRPAGPSPRTTDFSPRAPRGDQEEEDQRRSGFRKARPPASVTARFGPPKKEQAAVPKEKRPNNRRDEEKLLLNWKEEVGLDDGEGEGDWLAFGEGEDDE